MFTAAVVGPPLDREPEPVLIFDALPDMLTGEGECLRLLVPVTGASLTAGVQAVVQWAWQMGNAGVVAVYDDHLLYDDIERHFIEEDADEVVSQADVAEALAVELANALPRAALICALYDTDADDFTARVMHKCFELRVPVYDVSQGMLELSVHDLDGWENAPAPEPAEDDESPQEAAPSTNQPASATVPHPASQAETELLRAALRDVRREIVTEVRREQNILALINTALGDEPEQEPRHGIEISTDKGETWHPRRRGRAPHGSIERDAVTKKIIRRN